MATEPTGEGADERDGLPEGLEAIITGLGVYVPDHLSKEARVHYARMLNSQCLACASELGSSTVVTINALGVILIFCSPVCMTDYHVQGWLQEVYDDLVDKIKFRGGGADGNS